MELHGLQKMTLLDFPGKVACTVFLGGCNLRCPYCHNSGLIRPDAPPATDSGALLDFLRKRRGLLDGVAFTGGEPLLRDLRPLLREVRALGYAVKLDTNGTRPDRLSEVLEEGLADYVAMDVKNSPERYAETAGLPALDLTPIRESIALLLRGRADYEFRTTAVAQLHDEASFLGIGEMIRGARRWFLQPFADRDSVAYAGFTPPDSAALARYVALMRPFVEQAELRGAE